MNAFLRLNACFLFVLSFLIGCASNAHADFSKAREKVLALQNLTQAPAMVSKDGTKVELAAGKLQAIYYEALPYEGKATRVYAWLGLPQGATVENKVPAMVLVHGGGGTAWKEWVEKWNARGFAAVSIAVEGQTDDLLPKESKKGSWRWQAHAWPGPRRPGIYNDLKKKKLEDQWMYHSVADAILANSLLRSLPQVDSSKIGIMGVSWGGVITSTVIGIDQRFAFAIPTYGCGDLSQARNKYGKTLGKNAVYQNVWDPILRLERATLPTLWLSWPGDQHFPLDKQASSYNTVSGPYMVSLVPGMGHSQKAAMKPDDSYAFAQSIVGEGKPWAKQIASTHKNGQVEVSFQSSKKIDKAIVFSSKDSVVSGDKQWLQTDAKLSVKGDVWTVTAILPKGTRSWFINATSGDLTLSSDYIEKM